eukprot:7033012-Ditylum_brightwellii.AAC.1
MVSPTAGQIESTLIIKSKKFISPSLQKARQCVWWRAHWNRVKESKNILCWGKTDSSSET